jgi:hypothetical protein
VYILFAGTEPSLARNVTPAVDLTNGGLERFS